MKTSCRFGKGNLKHNTREFESREAEYDASRTCDNIYVAYAQPEGKKATYYKMKNHQYEPAIKKFYADIFGSYINAQNERNIAARHSERCKTADERYEAHNGVKEVILQIGNKDQAPDSKCLLEATITLMQHINDHYKQVEVLGFAMHLDETTPHVHLELAFKALNERGEAVPDITKALQQAGVMRPDPQAQRGRYNNELMTFTKDIQQVFLQKAREQDLTLDDIEHNSSKHLTVNDYKQAMMHSDISKAQQKLEFINGQIKIAEESPIPSFKMRQENAELKRQNTQAQQTLERVKAIAPDAYDIATSKNLHHIQQKSRM